MRTVKISKILFSLFVLCILFLVLGQFSAVIKFDQASLYLFDVSITLFDFVGLTYLLVNNKPFRTPLPITFLFAFVALGITSLLFTPLSLEAMEFTTAISYSVRLLSYIVFGALVYNLINLDILQIDSIRRVIIYSGFFLFTAGIAQLIFLPDLETLDPLFGWDPHKNRMAATFFDPNFLGIYFVICLALSSKQKLLANKRGLLNYLTPAVFLLGILLTFSRSAWLATSILLFFTLLRKKYLLLVSIAIVLLAVFAVPKVQTRISGVTDPQDSASFRLISWRNTWEITKENWVFGVGYNAFRYVQRDFGFLDNANFSVRSGAGSDSSLLLAWATSGIVGLVFFLGFYIVILTHAVKTRDLVIIGLVTALLFNSLFINSLFYPQIFVAFLMVVWWPLKDSNL